MAIGPLQIFLILLIVILLFGTKKLRNIGSDLGGAIRSFKKSVKDGPDEGPAPRIKENQDAGIEENQDARFEKKKEND